MLKADKDTWNPKQYNIFEKERSLPFFDLLALVKKEPQMQVVDLGCGTGQLTLQMHSALKAKTTLGIDASEAMLKEAAKIQAESLRFELADIGTFAPQQTFDLVFSNAALQWLPNHQQLFPKIAQLVGEKGQLAIQVPANFDFPSHTLAKAIGATAPFSEYLSDKFSPGVLSIEEYAALLHQLGFKEQSVRAQVYPLYLKSYLQLIEWVRGTLLTFYQTHLPEHLYTQFLEEYTSKLREHFGNDKPVFVPFKRILIWGAK